MGARFRKRIRIAKGLYWNFSWSKKNGVTNSASIGQPGSNLNVGIKKDRKIGVRRGTVGIPGSGLRYDASLDASLNSRKTRAMPRGTRTRHFDSEAQSGGIISTIFRWGLATFFLLVIVKIIIQVGPGQ